MRQPEDRGPALWTAVAAGSLGLLGRQTATAGRLSWAAPLVCLPLAWAVAWLWRRAGDPSRWPRSLALLYYLWALVLLAGCAGGYAVRLTVTLPGGAPWLYLLTAAGLSLWLSRGEGKVTLRAGRLFFGATAAVLALAVALSLPGLRGENLWPVEGTAPTGLSRAALLTLSGAGWGVYGLCLPGESRRPRHWTAALCLLWVGLLVALVGSFGPVLAARRSQPVLLLLEGVRVPGVFRHGEAALEGGLALADLCLLSVLTYGCAALGRRLAPGWPEGWGRLPAAVAILSAGLLLPEGYHMIEELVAPWGNLLAGAILPAGMALGDIFHKRAPGGGGTVSHI